jgi:integrase
MKKLHRLSDRTVKTTPPGKYCDGAGLYLVVVQGRTGVNRNWLIRYGAKDRQRWHGLGAYPIVSLAEARRRAQDARELLATGKDPISFKRSQRAALSQEEPVKTMTFRQCAEAYIVSHEAAWRGARATHRWTQSLTTHAYPLIGDKDVANVTTEDVLSVLMPLWTALPETAVQVRGRIEMILDWARVRGFRVGENVARWRGHLAHLLPKHSRVAHVQHHPALPYKELPAFMVELRQRDEIAAQCLEFLILTACRTAEAVLARWDEIDLEARIWNVPPDRTKSGRSHRVPLSESALRFVRRRLIGQTLQREQAGRHGIGTSLLGLLRAEIRFRLLSLAEVGFRFRGLGLGQARLLLSLGLLVLGLDLLTLRLGLLGHGLRRLTHSFSCLRARINPDSDRNQRKRQSADQTRQCAPRNSACRCSYCVRCVLARLCCQQFGGLTLALSHLIFGTPSGVRC